jgi:hypothetical protein
MNARDDTASIASMTWRRLDVPGHDACRLEQTAQGWALDGTAVFQEHAPARVAYRVECDRAWITRRGHVTGWLGTQALDVTFIRNDDGIWTLNGVPVDAVSHCVDLDLGFTPATNLLQIRRLALKVGESADAPVAWFDLEATTLVALPQRYERRTQTSYWYESPTANYAAMLDVTPDGFVRTYPALWESGIEPPT